MFVFGLIYACGALIELLVRVFQGIPRYVPPILNRHLCCTLCGQPVVFFLLPAMVWPFIMVHRILQPIIGVCRECCWDRDDSGITDDIGLSTPERRNITSNDVEKGWEARRETVPGSRALQA